MILITGFGLMMMALSLLMIISPHTFSKGIIRFSQLTYFHIFEMMSRLFFGVVFVYYSPLTLAPTINVVLGYLMLIAAAVLCVVGAKKHRTFALWSATKFRSTFRFFGLFSLVFGGYIVYTSI
jgi:hypothetical protein